jgi:adenylate kinase
MEFNPPKVEGVCDVCGGEVRQRQDDTPEAIEKRLDLYEQETAPLISYYRDRGLVTVVNGDQPIGDVTSAIEQAITSAAAAR